MTRSARYVGPVVLMAMTLLSACSSTSNTVPQQEVPNSGNVYVTNYGTGDGATVTEIRPDETTSLIASGKGPNGVAVAPAGTPNAGELYIGNYKDGTVTDVVNPPGESGDSKLIETMLPHRYSDRYRRCAPISQAAYLRSIHTGAGC